MNKKLLFYGMLVTGFFLSGCVSNPRLVNPQSVEKIDKSAAIEYSALEKEESEINMLHNQAKHLLRREFSKIESQAKETDTRGGGDMRFNRVLESYKGTV